MKQFMEDKGRIRQYLLGVLPEVEQRRIEELFILNPDYREHVSIIEDELIEDYLDGELSEEEGQQFTAYFLATPQQRRRLQIARSLKSHAAQSADERTVRKDFGRRKSLHWLSWRNPFFALPVAAVLLIFVLVGTGKVLEVRRLSQQREQEQIRRAAIERELAQVNDPGGARSGQVFAVVLPPVSVRGMGQGPAGFTPPADAPVVELRLVLIGEEFQSYRVLLQRVGEPGSFAIQNLRAESTPEGRAVTVRVPAHLLSRGDYQLQLLGVGAGGQAEPTGDYTFQVIARSNN